MNSKQFLESTTSGSVATVATPVGKTQTRGKGIYPNEKGGNLLTGKKTNKKFPNTVNEYQEKNVVEANNRLTIPDSPYTRKNFGSEKLVEILKSRGWQGPFQIQQLGKKWIKSLDGLHGIDTDDYAMVQGKDPRYDGWVVYTGTYVFGIEYGYHTGDANKVANWTKDWNQDLSEAKLDEEDVIIVPGQGNRIKPGFIPRKADRTDHEVEMAKSDLFQSNKNAKKIYELIKDIPETVGIEGWVQEKIIKANDYLNTVREYLEHKQMSEMTVGVIAGGGVGEGVAEGTFGQNRTQYPIGSTVSDKDGNKYKVLGHNERSLLLKGTVDGNRVSLFPHQLKQGVAEGMEKLTPQQKAHEYNLDAAQREIDRREAEGEDMTGAKIDKKTYKIIKPKQGVAEGYRILPNIDCEKYQEREGLEGPFRARNGKVYYYDPKAGMAYDPDTDFYIDYDDLRMMDTEMSEGVDDTKKKISKYEELALAANRAGDDAKCKLYQRKIQALKQKMTQNVDEGIVGKVLGGAALLAALWGIGQNQAQQVYSNSPQLQTLIKYHQMATQQNDQAKIQELERRIENHKTRLSVGKGEVMGSDDKPIVPKYESSIMKGIQNEQSDDDYYGWSTKSTGMRDKMKHELGHETNNYAVMINGKTWKVFADKRQADNVARSLVNKGKDAYVSLTGASITEVAKSSFRQSSEDQASRYVDKIKSSNISDWEKEYLILVNDPKGSVFRAAYHSFPKGQEARKLVVNYIANKYNVSTDEIENLDMRELAKDFMESKCPDCGGKLVAENELTEENKDACYYKVKSRYKVWPSAYASGSLVQCRKKGASNWGNKSK